MKPCKVWTGALTRNGYGQMRRDGRVQRVHRVAYEENVGPIPEGMDLDHLCRTRACWEFTHLEPVTRRENLMRGTTIAAAKAAQVACVNGHPFNEPNTLIRPNGTRRAALAPGMPKGGGA